MWKALTASGLVYCSYRELHAQVKEGLVAVSLQNSFKGNSFAIDNSGLALTTKHTAEGTLTTADGQYIEVISRHPALDVALLQLPRHLSYSRLKVADLNQLKIGDRLFLFGMFYTDYVVTTGIFQRQVGTELYSSCQMRHGQSGGPVVNTKGEVVGINAKHYPCTEEKKENDVGHYGNSIHISIDAVKEWLKTLCEETETGWKLRDVS